MRDLLRRFDAVAKPSMSVSFRPASHSVQRGIRVQLDLRHVRDDAEFGGLGGPDDGTWFCA